MCSFVETEFRRPLESGDDGLVLLEVKNRLFSRLVVIYHAND
jgi:hypothetical protein